VRIDAHIGRRALLRRRLLKRLAQFYEQLLLPRFGQVPLDRDQEGVAGAEVVHEPGLGQAGLLGRRVEGQAVMPWRSVTRTAARKIWIFELGRMAVRIPSGKVRFPTRNAPRPATEACPPQASAAYSTAVDELY